MTFLGLLALALGRLNYLFKSLMSRFLCFQIKKRNAVKVFNTMY